MILKDNDGDIEYDDLDEDDEEERKPKRRPRDRRRVCPQRRRAW